MSINQTEQEQYEVEYILNCKKEAEDATDSIRKQWKELWNLYQGRQDYSNKKDWQSQMFVPRTYMMIEQATSVVKRAVMSPRRLFKLIPKYAKDQVAKEMQPKVEEALFIKFEESNFSDVYSDSMKGGFVRGVCFPKLVWSDGGLMFSNPEAENIFVTPTYVNDKKRSPKYIIERKEMDLAEFREMARAINKKAGKQIYKMSVINNVNESTRESDDELDDRNRKGLSDHSKKDSKVVLLEFWGGIVDKDNKKIKKNQLRVVMNGKYIVRSQDNPFEHQKPPHIPTIPIPYPNRGVSGISLVGPVAKLQYAYNNVFNLMLDNLNFSVNKMFEIDTNNAYNVQSIQNFYPGKIIQRQGPNRIVDEVEVTQVGNDAFATLALLGQEMEKGTAVTEYIQGQGGKRQTATEVETKTAQAQGLFDTIARGLESQSLQRIVEMAYSLCVQYEEIPAELEDRYIIRVGGLSLILMQQRQKQEIMECIALASQNEQAGKRTNFDALYKKYLDVNNLSDVYTDRPGEVGGQNAQGIRERAAEDAKNAVANMSPEQIMGAQA